MIINILLITLVSSASAQPARIIAVLLYSPSCGHCHKVMTEDLPPLQAEYGAQLQIYLVDTTTPAGQVLFSSTIDHYQVPENRRGVPMLVVGNTVLVGAQEIPQQFPSIIESGLAHNGIDLPEIPGLDTSELTLFQVNPDSSVEATPEQISTSSPVNIQPEPTNRPSIVSRFQQDPVGNTLAVILLIGMIICITWAAWNFMTKSEIESWGWSNWVVPVLSFFGLFVAGYMTFIETTHSQALCGPIGNCNAVQQSPYAYVLGFIPVGILGLVGYLSVLVSWLLYKLGPAGWQKFTAIVCWSLVWFGVIFSLYLTFLEPFIIGATCAWCLTSATIMTVLLLATTGPAINAWNKPS